MLAYSTVSQLGYMAMALGVGAWTAAVFHLFTHAFFKANLFLGSGSVAHAVHSFDMKKDMGGMRKFMPKTYVTFVIGSLASPVFPARRLLVQGRDPGQHRGLGHPRQAWLGTGQLHLPLRHGHDRRGLTAAYMTRCVYLTFTASTAGPPRRPRRRPC